ncbi:MAG: copper chaperone PCu(A)C [Gammaproteobacteria bacterium]|nr:copper chaperone PCu(A)C [Gammaproteobacteria bacterium]
MNSFLRAIMQAILLTATIGLFACDSSTVTTTDNQPSAAADVATNVAESITVNMPRIRATAPGQSVTGAFMTLVNNSATASALISVSFDGASTVEVHETSMNEGRMRMQKVSQIDIPANGSAELKPGSYHVMLIGLEKDMQAGTVENLTLTFSDGSQKTVEALVDKLSE